jgi:hypothetical protein
MLLLKGQAEILGALVRSHVLKTPDMGGEANTDVYRSQLEPRRDAPSMK